MSAVMIPKGTKIRVFVKNGGNLKEDFTVKETSHDITGDEIDSASLSNSSDVLIYNYAKARDCEVFFSKKNREFFLLIDKDLLRSVRRDDPYMSFMDILTDQASEEMKKEIDDEMIKKIIEISKLAETYEQNGDLEAIRNYIEDNKSK